MIIKFLKDYNINRIVKSYNISDNDMKQLKPLVIGFDKESSLLIYKAFILCRESHKGQYRKSGEEYYKHPLEVAKICKSWGCDYEMICAALLHDVIEDTDVTYNDIELQFGKTIADMADGLSKIGENLEQTKLNKRNANFYKLIEAMKKDVRIMVVKIADRLHNMRTLHYLPIEKQKSVAKETEEIFAPIAYRLGFDLVWNEFSEIIFKVKYPLRYTILEKEYNKNQIHSISVVENNIKSSLLRYKIKCDLTSRKKSLHSIYLKMVDKNLKYKQVLDKYGIRIIVQNKMDCYIVLGIVHELYDPIPFFIKDYIASPKSNGYQSLHTAVVGPNGSPIEIQIRTKTMDDIAEKGITSHWFYKNSKKENFDWINNLLSLDIENEIDNKLVNEIIYNMKNDMNRKEIVVFDSFGTKYILPKGSTVLDLAFLINDNMALQLDYAVINKIKSSINKKIKDGDFIELFFNNEVKPTNEWLGYSKTTKAMNCLNNYFSNFKNQ